MWQDYTLSVHISQQWGEGKLFTDSEFDYVILIRLRDPAVQNARCIAVYQSTTS